jgi:tripartite-type tricarboxylate transporter receptor subunit TctC
MKSGRGKVIGISTAKKSPLDPSWATPRDAGIPDLDASIWVGPLRAEGHAAGGDRPRQQGSARDAEACRRCRRSSWRSAGAEAIGMTPAEFLARIKSDAERYKRVVQKGGVKPG